MVTIQVSNLIDFVAEVFSRSKSSPEEATRYVVCRCLTIPGQRSSIPPARSASAKSVSSGPWP